MPGSTSTSTFPSTGARANSSSPTAIISDSPATSGTLIPNRITSRSESSSEDAPQISVDGR